MIRRRPFWRHPGPLRRIGPRPRGLPLPQKIRLGLARANKLLEAGEFVEAAGIFGHMSDRAREHNMSIRAADLALQASRGYFAADDVATALTWAKSGIRLLVRGGRVERVPRVLSRIVEALREKGHDVEADQVELEAAQALEEVGLSLDEARQRATQVAERRGPARGRTLPARCAGCGAPLVPDEVEWHDAHSAKCIYCGTVAKAT